VTAAVGGAGSSGAPVAATIVLPAMPVAQENSWRALLDVQQRVATGWCLVGGQLVQLLCCERGVAPNRPTNDGDTVLDVRSRPTILFDFTTELSRLGFRSAGESSKAASTVGQRATRPSMW
jgi:hypothetical protein